MSEIFELCESNFYKNIRQAQKNLKQGSLSEMQLQQISQSLKDATQELNKMQIEYSLNRLPQMKSKIDLFRGELKNYRRQLSQYQQRVRIQNEQKSGPLFERDQDIQNGINPLIEAKRKMYENEMLSNQAAQKINEHNDRLKNGIRKMDDINNQLTIAHKLLGSISKKLKKNKFILWGTLAFLVLVLCLIVYSYVK